MTKVRRPVKEKTVPRAKNPPYQQEGLQSSVGGSIWSKKQLNKLAPKLLRTHLLCLRKELGLVRERIQEVKGLGSELDPVLAARKQCLKAGIRMMKACNAC